MFLRLSAPRPHAVLQWAPSSPLLTVELQHEYATQSSADPRRASRLHLSSADYTLRSEVTSSHPVEVHSKPRGQRSDLNGLHSSSSMFRVCRQSHMDQNQNLGQEPALYVERA